MPLVATICLNCLKLFESLDWEKRKYCSYKCSVDYKRGKTYEEMYGDEKGLDLRKARSDSRKAQKKPENYYRIACRVCGVEFETDVWSKKTYCSKKCEGLAHRGSNNSAWKEKTELACAECFNQIIVAPCWVRNPAFCSRECYTKWKKRNEINSGENNPNWKGGPVKTACVNPSCVAEVFLLPCELGSEKYCSLRCYQDHQFGQRQGKRWDSKSRWGMKWSKKGTRKDLGIYVRSSWEANYARFLKWLKERGEIKDWSYETKTFEFEGIKRGRRFYTPDFPVVSNDGSVEYHEVKGYDYAEGKTALKRMRIYHPNEKIIIVDESWFKQARKQGLDGIIPYWE